MKSWIEISSSALRHNVAAIHSAAGSGVELLAVIKADGYGHSAQHIAPVLATAGVGWLGTGDAGEGVRIRAVLGTQATRVLVMIGMEPGDAPAIVTHGLTPVIWTPAHVAALDAAAQSAGARSAVHLEIETGMARQGAAPGSELAAVLHALANAKAVDCEGVMTHLCASEVAGSPVTAAQLKRFESAIAQVIAAGVRPRLLHLGNSSAIDEGSTMDWVRERAAAIGAQPMVRPGLALYGHCLPVQAADSHRSATAHLAAQLQPVMTWKTRVIGVREIAPGASVGYGATFTAGHAMCLALLPLGYADGFRRAASSGLGNGWVMLHGQRAPVVGRVSMNLIVVDITAIEGVGIGDEATLLGPGVSAEDHARWDNTISYEILCGVRARFEVR